MERGAGEQLKSFVERVERLEEEIRSLNSDKRDIYAEAKGNGFDVSALKRVIAYRRKDPELASAAESIFETYLTVIQGAGSGTFDATRARARGERGAGKDA